MRTRMEVQRDIDSEITRRKTEIHAIDAAMLVAVRACRCTARVGTGKAAKKRDAGLRELALFREARDAETVEEYRLATEPARIERDTKCGVSRDSYEAGRKRLRDEFESTTNLAWNMEDLARVSKGPKRQKREIASASGTIVAELRKELKAVEFAVQKEA